MKLLNRQSARLLNALRKPFELHQAHWVSVVLHELPAHCPLEKNVHHTADVALALRRQAEPLKPYLYSERLHLGQRSLLPAWIDVIDDPRLVAIRCSFPLRQCFLEEAIDEPTESHNIRARRICDG